MKYSFHPEAEAEFNQAIDYYERCSVIVTSNLEFGQCVFGKFLFREPSHRQNLRMGWVKNVGEALTDTEPPLC